MKFYKKLLQVTDHPPFPNEARIGDKNLIKNIGMINCVLRLSGLNICVSGGTALWLFRDQRLAPHDNDVDFSIFVKEKDESPHNIVIRYMTEMGYRLFRTVAYDGRVTQTAFVKDDVIWDFKYHLEWDNGMFYNPITEGVMVSPPWEMGDSDCFAELMDWIYVQTPIIEFLEWEYGKDWKTPHTEKDDWMLSAPKDRFLPWNTEGVAEQ